MTDKGDAFVAYLSQHLQLINDSILARVPSPIHAEEQIRDLDGYLYGPVVRFVNAGGKRTRPALCLLGAEAVGASATKALSVAAAVELFQTAALIHDDIADQSTMRRGVPCLHVSDGVGLAINAGDAALVAVVNCILRDDSHTMQTRIRLLEEIVDMENRTLEGQALDIGWARDNRWDISVTDYLAMARCKTAYYSAATPLALGAICGGGQLSQVEGLRRFGLRTGLAFQIQDDLLNLVGDEKAQGKDYRSDISEGKRTLVMVWALEHLEEDDRDELVRILLTKTSNRTRIDRAVELAQKSGALDYARDYARTLVANANDELRGLDIAESSRAVLLSMSDFFIERTH